MKNYQKIQLKQQLFSEQVSEPIHQDQYLVQKIVDQCIKEGTIYFLLKWKDYSDNQNTWQPIYHLSKSLYILNEWMIEQHNRKEAHIQYFCKKNQKKVKISKKLKKIKQENIQKKKNFQKRKMISKLQMTKLKQNVENKYIQIKDSCQNYGNFKNYQRVITSNQINILNDDEQLGVHNNNKNQQKKINHQTEIQKHQYNSAISQNQMQQNMDNQIYSKFQNRQAIIKENKVKSFFEDKKTKTKQYLLKYTIKKQKCQQK